MIINSMDVGGAESCLESLSYSLDPLIEVEIISLSGSGKVAYRMKERGYQVHELNFGKTLLFVNEILKLFFLIKKIKPDVVHTWMYHSNLLGGFAAKILGVKKIIWSIHAFNIKKGMLRFRTRFLVHILAFFSYFIPQKIIFCSQSSLLIHKKIFYSKKKSIFIPNGINSKNFFYSEDFRTNLRIELGFTDREILVGCIGRFDIQKNQIGFLDIISRVTVNYPNYHFLYVGKGNDSNNTELLSSIQAKNLESKVHLLGERDDINKILSAIDIFTLPSRGEAFPISLCEAMLCEVPCIATNVGDVDFIIGGITATINLSSFDLFYNSIINIGEQSKDARKLIGRKLKDRVNKNFLIEKVAISHQEIYEN